MITQQRVTQENPPSEMHENQHTPILSEADQSLLANVLGWLSLGLGIVQVLMPGRVTEMIGVNDNHSTRTLMRLVGVREIVSGIGILKQIRPVGWLWGRVAGDVMDLALLGKALTSEDADDRARLAATMLPVAGITVLDLIASEGFTSNPYLTRDQQPFIVHVTKSITINREPEAVYEFWRNFENLPRFMGHLESVEVISPRRSYWKTNAPAGMTVEWEAGIIQEIPNELIVWRSLDGSDVFNAGSVQFRPAPGNRGTEITVEMRYEAPAGQLGVMIAKLFGEEPELQIADDLRAFKQVMETGEVVRSDGAVLGKRWVHRVAQPNDEKGELER